MSKTITMADVLTNPKYLLTVEALELSRRSYNCLVYGRHTNERRKVHQSRDTPIPLIADIIQLEISEEGNAAYSSRVGSSSNKIEGFGAKSIREVAERLAEFGLSFNTQISDRPTSDTEFYTQLSEAASKMADHTFVFSSPHLRSEQLPAPSGLEPVSITMTEFLSNANTMLDIRNIGLSSATIFWSEQAGVTYAGELALMSEEELSMLKSGHNKSYKVVSEIIDSLGKLGLQIETEISDLPAEQPKLISTRDTTPRAAFRDAVAEQRGITFEEFVSDPNALRTLNTLALSPRAYTVMTKAGYICAGELAIMREAYIGLKFGAGEQVILDIKKALMDVGLSLGTIIKDLRVDHMPGAFYGDRYVNLRTAFRHRVETLLDTDQPKLETEIAHLYAEAGLQMTQSVKVSAHPTIKQSMAIILRARRLGQQQDLSQK